MRIRLLLLLSFLFVLKGFSQNKPVYVSNVEDYVNKHNTIAILPFMVNSKPQKLPDGMTQEMLHESEIERGYALQNSMFSFYSRKLRKKALQIKDVDEVNRILKKNNVTPDNVFDLEPKDLAKMLEVDALILNKALTDEPLTTGAKAMAFAKKFAFGLGSSKMNITTTIYDGAEGKNIWRWQYEVKGGMMDADDATERIMKVFSQKSPYKHKED